MRSRTLIALFLMLTAVFLIAVQPAAAQQGVVWNAQYYDNPTLSGEPEFTRQDNAIAFNWGQGAPGSDISSNNFSVRWGTDVYLPAGTYRFYALADDDVRVIVDFQLTPLIDTFGSNTVGQVISRDITLEAGTHHIQVDYRELTGDAYVFVSWANLATNPTGPSFQTPVNVPVTGGAWTAQYYANPNLAGAPTLIQSEDNPSENWGDGSPAPSIPADNWSARWTSVQFLNGGNYRISAQADDGVRVWVNGVLAINEWHPASGLTYTANLTLPTGQHNFLIEFYESAGLAYLDYELTLLNPQQPAVPTPPPVVPGSPTGASATVNTGRLNVRAIPDPVNGQILTKIDRGETYPLLARNLDGSWVQLNVNGTIGWVNSSYVVLNNAGGLPVIGNPAPGAPQQPQPTGVTVTAQPYSVNIRQGPGTQFERLAVFRRGDTAQVLARTAANTWYQISYNGTVGWVSAPYVQLSAGANLNNVPVLG